MTFTWLLWCGMFYSSPAVGSPEVEPNSQQRAVLTLMLVWKSKGRPFLSSCAYKNGDYVEKTQLASRFGKKILPAVRLTSARSQAFKSVRSV